MNTKPNVSPKSNVPHRKPDPVPGVTVPDVPEEIFLVLDELRALFCQKNAEYSDGQRWDANFYDAAPVANHLMSPLMYCMTQCAKQDDAFWKAMNRSESEFDNLYERLRDGAVYRMIALALLAKRRS